MIEFVRRLILPSAFTLLPRSLNTPEATAMLLAIGLQESRFLARRQGGKGPARGFWQFEEGGALGVLRHRNSGPLVKFALDSLCYFSTPTGPELLDIIEHNDIIAAVFARALLFTSPAPLPAVDDQAAGWALYTGLWRPGAPRPETWAALYGEAWDRQLLHAPTLNA